MPEGPRLKVEFVSPTGLQWGVFERPEGDWPAGGSGSFDFNVLENGVFRYEPSEFTASSWGHAAHTMDIVKLFGIPIYGVTAP